MEFKINKEIFNIAPTLKVGVLALSGIDNKKNVTKFFDEELAKVTKSLVHKFDGIELGAYPLLQRWREIYKSFGERKARSSIEALIRRIVGGKGLYRINALVDLYNLASLNFELPCGGEDLDAMNGLLELTIATVSEEFLPLGSTEIEHPNKGEIIYKTGNTVVCRNFNYRESDITKLTEDTKNAIIVFEDVMSNELNLEKALDWMSNKAKSLLGAEVNMQMILDAKQPELAKI